MIFQVIRENVKERKRIKKEELLKIKNLKHFGVNLTSEEIEQLRKKAIDQIKRDPYNKSHWRLYTNRYLDYLIKDKLLDSPLFEYDPRHFREPLNLALHIAIIFIAMEKKRITLFPSII
ncbi:MAG: hypothetical protein ACFFA5_08750 [Promethearchaeota archaeon]